MMKLLSLVTVALMVSMTSAIPLVPITRISQKSDNDVIDAKNLQLNVDMLNGHHDQTPSPHENTPSPPPSQGSPSSPPYGTHISQVSDDDLIDAKNAKIGISILNHRQALDDLISTGFKSFKRKLPAVVKQSSDNDLVDLKNFNLDIKAGNGLLSRQWLEPVVISQKSDDDLLDMKSSNIDIDVLNDLHLRQVSSVTQESDDDLLDMKDSELNIDSLDGLHTRLFSSPSVNQKSDDDMLDMKKMKVNVDAANDVLRKRDNIEQEFDEDLIDAQNLDSDIDTLNRKAIEEALSILRRANYPVDAILRKRSSGDIYQEVQGDYTCLCSKTLTASKCNTPSPPHQLKPSVRPSLVAHHTGRYTLPIEHPSTFSVKAIATPVKHVDIPATSVVAVPTIAPLPIVSCPTGWTQAAPGSIMQHSDNDLIDLKNLKLDINILNNTGETTSSRKAVPAIDQPKCTGHLCCYQQSTTPGPLVKQTSDNDLLDLKNLNLGLNLLNGLHL